MAPAETPRATLHNVDSGGVTLSVAAAGPADGPAVLLLHGFPELAYSWRHQISALSTAGFRVLAPDQRGYGASGCPEAVEAYNMVELVADACAVLDHFGHEEAVIIGHDFGSIVAGGIGLLRPDRVRGLGLMSVPFLPVGDQSPIERLRAEPNESFDYILQFQEEGIEEFLDADPIGFLRRVHWSVGGEGGQLADGDPTPRGLPTYLTDGDFEAYTRAFARNGLGPPINWYRNLHRNWELMRPWRGAKLQPPVAFCGGELDFVVDQAGPGLAGPGSEMSATCLDFRGATIVEGAGHWVQQEAPQAVNAWIAEFIASLD